MREAAKRPKEEKIFRRPPLRLRPDRVVALAAPDALNEAVRAVGEPAVRSVAVTDPRDDAVQAVVVSLDRYLELVGAKFVADQNYVLQPDGSLTPADLPSADVEPTDPSASWLPPRR